MECMICIREAAKLSGVSVKTLQRWEREGRLIPVARTGSNRRRYTETKLREFVELRNTVQQPTRVVDYCHVSSPAQRCDLITQRNVVEEFVAAKELKNVEFVEDIGGGLNFTRKKRLLLMNTIGRGRSQNINFGSSRSIDTIRV